MYSIYSTQTYKTAPPQKKSHTKDSLIKFKINNIKIINEKINSNFDIKQNKGY